MTGRSPLQTAETLPDARQREPRRPCIVKVRMTDAERQAVEAAAGRLSLSEFGRRAILGAVETTA